MAYLYLTLAIFAEVLGTAALKASAGFTKFGPSVGVILGYGVAFFFFSLALRSIPMGVAYAIWSGMGIVVITLAGFLLFQQKIDLPGIIGICLIVAGVIVLNAFSNSATH